MELSAWALQAIIGVAVGTGAVRMGMNGIYKRLDRHDGKLDDIGTAVSKQGERISRLEGLHERE